MEVIDERVPVGKDIGILLRAVEHGGWGALGGIVATTAGLSYGTEKDVRIFQKTNIIGEFIILTPDALVPPSNHMKLSFERLLRRVASVASTAALVSG